MDAILPTTQTDKLIDKFGRQVTYVRISVTDRCDFRCVYCMSEEMTFLPREQVLTLEEITRLSKAFVEMGVSKIRITGGEPLVRKDIVNMLADVAKLEGLDELVITTNGSQLVKLAQPLKTAGVKRINISLDSLDAEKFRKVTRVGELENDKLAELKDQLAALSKKQDTRATLTIRANEACGRMKMQRAALVAKIKDRRLHAEEHGQALPGGEGTDRLLELVDDVAASGQMQ